MCLYPRSGVGKEALFCRHFIFNQHKPFVESVFLVMEENQAWQSEAIGNFP
jgi:hypothetical protein